MPQPPPESGIRPVSRPEPQPPPEAGAGVAEESHPELPGAPPPEEPAELGHMEISSTARKSGSARQAHMSLSSSTGDSVPVRMGEEITSSAQESKGSLAARELQPGCLVHHVAVGRRGSTHGATRSYHPGRAAAHQERVRRRVWLGPYDFANQLVSCTFNSRGITLPTGGVLHSEGAHPRSIM